jgi:hypothetical protein
VAILHGHSEKLKLPECPRVGKLLLSQVAPPLHGVSHSEKEEVIVAVLKERESLVAGGM